jgi:hypothetical protein
VGRPLTYGPLTCCYAASMSLCQCPHLGEKLPDAQTCGARCESFPACLPPLPDLAAMALRVRQDRQSEADVSEALGQVHAAIIKGLESR